MNRNWTFALALTGLYLLGGWALDAGSGLTRIVITGPSVRSETTVRNVNTLDLRGVNVPALASSAPTVTVKWEGAWRVPASALYDLSLDSHGHALWKIDSQLALEASPDAGVITRTVWLSAGFHRIDITDEPGAGVPRVAAGIAPMGHYLASLTGLRPSMPRHPQRREWAIFMSHLLGWAAFVSIVWAVRRTVARRRDAWRGRLTGVPWLNWRTGMGRTLAWAVLAVMLTYGALLRLDSITAHHGPVTSPRWLAALQTRAFARPEAIRPASMSWGLEPLYPHRDGPATHYFSDPYIYLDDARHMPSFYAAHFREPVFPFATRTFLHLLSDQDVAVSFASAFFSVLAIWFTYILGAAVWSRPVGLLAALGLTLDGDVISHAGLGWRDDAYVAVVALCLYLLLRCWRSSHRAAVVRTLGRIHVDEAYLEAAALGVAAGLAILTRIMAVPFLAAGVAWLVCGPRASRRRVLAMAAVTIVTTLIVAGPYFINCWRVYGDPLYTFNVHGGIYSVAEGRAPTGNTADYVREKIASNPVEAVDTVAQGMTTYPFSKKWRGLNAWHARLGEWASASALIGMVLIVSFAPGRLLLIAMLGAMIPFSFTWRVDPNFRFTEFTYPALLIAAAVTIDVACRVVRTCLVPRREGLPSDRWKPSWLPWLAVVTSGAAVLWFVTQVSPLWAFRETLRTGATAIVTAGTRDATFLDRGWSDVIRAGDIVSVRAAIVEGSIALALPEANDYAVTVRMDPFPRPIGSEPSRLPAVDVSINGAAVAAVSLQWTIGHVGVYDFVLPRSLVHAGANSLGLRVRRPADVPLALIRPGLSDGDAICLWSVRVHQGTP